MSAPVRVAVYVQPRASKTEIAGMHDGCLKVRLAAPPVDGAANAALTEFIAERLGVARSRVRIVGGATRRRKVIEIDAIAKTVVDAALR